MYPWSSFFPWLFTERRLCCFSVAFWMMFMSTIKRVCHSTVSRALICWFVDTVNSSNVCCQTPDQNVLPCTLSYCHWVFLFLENKHPSADCQPGFRNYAYSSIIL
jgi:hypothetical protein